MKHIENFSRKHSYLLCVDSDGCVIDGMTVKHLECFGPGVIQMFGLKEWAAELLEYWNKINLYSMTRGINRFKGLALELSYAVQKGYLDLDISRLEHWTDTALELSNSCLEKQLAEKQSSGKETKVLRLALEWSQWVNERIAALPETKKQPFQEARAALKQAASQMDIAVVSSANAGAVQEEWERNGLLSMTDLLLTQEYGSKAACLSRLAGLGYDSSHILMVGDSPGDISAAKEAGVLYYPILPGQEEESWRLFQKEILALFLEGSYESERMTECEQRFYDSLK